MSKIDVFPLGHVKNNIAETGNPGYMEVESVIILSDRVPGDLYEGIEVFSHIEVDFYIHLKGHPSTLIQNNKAQKAPESNLFGNAIVKLLKREGRNITVRGLDALNGTQVIDIKPVMNEILPSRLAH